MEVVDVGTRPADEVLELLFEGGVLRSLLERYGAACFALVRSMNAPGFYRELITHSPTLDETTRSHVAFVVFYGENSGILTEKRRYTPHGEAVYYEQTQLRGLSINHDRELAAVIPMERKSESPKVELLPRGLNKKVRYSPELVDPHVFSHQMSRVATRLMEKFGVPESALPCLLFTHGSDFERHLVVPLDRNDPLRSLYEHVLTPLSEQFHLLSGYWKRRDGLRQNQAEVERGTTAVASLPGEIGRLAAEIERQGTLVEEQRASIQAKLKELVEAKAKRESERAETKAKRESERKSRLQQQADLVRKLQAELDAIATGQTTFRSAAEKDLKTASLQKRLFREQQRLTDYERPGLQWGIAGAPGKRDEISELKGTLKSLEWRIPDLEQKRKNYMAGLARARDALNKWTPENLSLESAKIQAIKEKLESEGYGDKVLRTDRPSAFDAIEVMHRTGKLGAGMRGNGGNKPMRILFLAANPTTTTRLDLEEELRSLENELRGVKYRDQVTLTACHAVRPDDLIRHVRAERPTVVHFSGHGTGHGIVLRNDEGGYTEVTGPSLKRFFADRGVDLVVLNACLSKAQAEMLPGSVKAVVGTTDSVGDVPARRFTVAFYRALGEGLTIAEAFRDGGDAVALNNEEDVFWSAGQLNQALVAHAG